MNKINVLFVSHFSDLKMGGQKSMTALIENLDKKRVKAFAIVPEKGELSKKLESLGCTVFNIPLFPLKPKHLFKHISVVRKLKKIIRQNAIDIIHPDYERDCFISAMAKSGTKAKLVWHVRLTQPKKIDQYNQHLADGIIGISDGVRPRFLHDPRIDKKYRTIFNGVDTKLFSPANNKDELKKKLKIDADRKTILFVGQLKEGKGIFDIINAWNIIKKNGTELPTLYMLGKYASDEIRIKTESMIKEYSLNEHIIIPGHKGNINEWMSASDLLILPSHEGTEGMGRVIFEAMACGAVPIVSDTSGVREAIDEKSGLFVNEKSPDEIANAISTLIGNDELIKEMATKGRQRAVNIFDIKIHAKNVMDFYEYVLYSIS